MASTFAAGIRTSASTEAGLVLQGTSLSHAPASGEASTGYGFDVATGHMDVASLAIAGEDLDATSAEMALTHTAQAGTVVPGKVVVYSGTGGVHASSLHVDDVAITATAAEINKLASNDVTADDLTKLHAVTATAAELNKLASNDVTADDLTKLHAVTATAAELNKLAGNDATADDLTKLHDVAATAAQIDAVATHDVTAADLTKLHGTTASAAELNQLDGAAAGVPAASKAVVYDGSGHVATTRVYSSSGALTLQSVDAGDIALSADSGVVDAGGARVENMAEPTGSTHAATKAYVDAQVDNVAGSIHRKRGAHTVATNALPASSYAAGTLTADANGALPDTNGVALAAGDYVLVAAQVAALENGLYRVTEAGDAGTPWTLVRSDDMDADAEFNGALVLVMGGAYGDTEWRVAVDAGFEVGTDDVTVAQFQTNLVSAGTALAKSGTTLNVDVSDATEIGEDLADADALLVHDASAEATRKALLSRIATYLNNHVGLTSLTALTAVGTIRTGTWESSTPIANAFLGSGIDATKIADTSVTNAAFQRLANVTSDVQAQLDAKIGSTLTADIDGDGTYTVANLPAPTASADAATKAYVDAAASSAQSAATSSANTYTNGKLGNYTFSGNAMSTSGGTIQFTSSAMPVAPMTFTRGAATLSFFGDDVTINNVMGSVAFDGALSIAATTRETFDVNCNLVNANSSVFLQLVGDGFSHLLLCSLRECVSGGFTVSLYNPNSASVSMSGTSMLFWVSYSV